jgi:hypothetical protein
MATFIPQCFLFASYGFYDGSKLPSAAEAERGSVKQPGSIDCVLSKEPGTLAMKTKRTAPS